jgi:transposase
MINYFHVGLILFLIFGDTVYLSSKKIKGIEYFYLQENRRVGKKVVTTFSKCVGNAKTVSDVLFRYVEDKGKGLLNEGNQFLKAKSADPYEFGTVSALLSVAVRNEIKETIDKHCPKRNQGLSLSDYLLLAAVNRATDPCSKLSFWDWFKDTTLTASFPSATQKNLSSQTFWNHMMMLDKELIWDIETDIVRLLVRNYEISTDILFFDNTNFFTYVDTDTASKLPQRGKSKEKRSDLRIVGLSLMCTATHNIPLLHSTYPGNENDAKRFSELLARMKDRIREIRNSEEPDVTLVFDRGNNSSANIEALAMDRSQGFHFVGGLKRNQFPELLDLSKEDFKLLADERLGDSSAFRTVREVLGDSYTVVVVHNPELYDAQIRGVISNIKTAQEKLKDLNGKLLKRKSGETVKGRSHTVESVEKNIRDILSREHMQMIFISRVSLDKKGCVCLSFKIDQKKFASLKEKILGKSVLFTDRHDWSTEKIVYAYRSQYHVEECFKQMKARKFLTFRPIFHYTDNNISVHAFYCVLALTLCAIMNLELERLGYKMTINKMLSEFERLKQSKLKYKRTNGTEFIDWVFSDESNTPEAVLAYAEKYNLQQYAETKGVNPTF